MTMENGMWPETPKNDSGKPLTIAELFARLPDIFRPSGFVKKEPRATDLSPVKPKRVDKEDNN